MAGTRARAKVVDKTREGEKAKDGERIRGARAEEKERGMAKARVCTA